MSRHRSVFCEGGCACCADADVLHRQLEEARRDLRIMTEHAKHVETQRDSWYGSWLDLAAKRVFVRTIQHPWGAMAVPTTRTDWAAKRSRLLAMSQRRGRAIRVRDEAETDTKESGDGIQ